MIKKIYALIKVFRLFNLLMIAFTLYVFRWYVFEPTYFPCYYPAFLSDFNFYLLMTAAVLSAAAGYIINDYFDQTIDEVNKPQSVVVGTIISHRLAMIIFYTFSALSVIFGGYVAYSINSINLTFIPIITAFMLWYYSFKYKRLFLWGNIVVAFFSGFVIVSLWLFEFFAMRDSVHGFVECKKYFPEATNIVFIYFVFAFLISLIREMVKDIEDIDGDKLVNRQTLPLKHGITVAKKVILGLIVIFVTYTAFVQWIMFKLNHTWVAIYSIVLISLPMIYTAYRLSNAQKKIGLHLYFGSY